MSAFYEQVATYYDGDAADFDARYWKNPLLQRIRQDFREEVKRHAFSNMLEIGYGSGLDLVHFGNTHPDASISGIDISAAMQQLARQRIAEQGLQNVTAGKGSVEDLQAVYPGAQFDMVCVFFGALNTVEDLNRAAGHLWEVTAPGGKMVLSFVNRNYFAGTVIELLKLRFRAAFARYKKEWGGYSPTQHLPGRCYSPSAIRNAFSRYSLIGKKGYSIVHPAWYYHRLNKVLRRFSPLLWNADRALNKTFLWSWGEYTLFVFKKPGGVNATDAPPS